VSGQPRLNVCGITSNSADRLEWWAGLAREYADEIALLVDADSDDATLELARRVADRVQVVEHPPFIEVAMDWGLRAASGDWVLWLDDDEVAAPGFAERVGELLADRDLTHYYQPYRWVLRDDGGGYGWIRTFPWYPNPRLRLLRRVGSVFAHRGRLHSPIEVAGEGRVLDDDDSAIYHLDFVWRDRAAREAKVARYRGHPAPSCEEYYLWEDYRSTLDVVTLDPSIIERSPSIAAQQRAAASASAAAADEGPPVTLATLGSAIARHWPHTDIFAAAYPSHTTPAQVKANRGYSVEVTVSNTSALRWRTTGPETGRVELSYHWVHPDHGVLLRDGDATLLPDVAAGATVAVTAGLWTPYEPGHYRLEWDLHCVDVGWFSERGVAPLAVDVDVEVADRLLGIPRTVARLPSRARHPVDEGRPALVPTGVATRARGRLGPPLRRLSAAVAPAAPVAPGFPTAANMVAVRPLRALDTRNGTGVGGAQSGPIKGGSVITLDLGGHPHLPGTVVGIAGQLSVVSADFDGFVTAYAADGTPGEALVSAFFRPGGVPSVNQVVVGLGTGSHAGQLSLHVSDHPTGAVQLLLDIFACFD